MEEVDMRFAHSPWLALVLVPAVVTAQEPGATRHDWRFMTRATLSGNSHESTPDGYEVYSGVSIEGAVARRLTSIFAVEVSLRTESREVEGPMTLPERRLGSLEVIASALTVKWQPRDPTGEVFEPFAGAGGVVTYAWEKSGLLDSSDPPISFDPVLQIGTHLVLTPTFMLTVDVKWQPLEMELEGFADPAPKVGVDPLVVGAGFGFSF
jgi:outer membrane protein W